MLLAHPGCKALQASTAHVETKSSPGTSAGAGEHVRRHWEEELKRLGPAKEGSAPSWWPNGQARTNSTAPSCKWGHAVPCVSEGSTSPQGPAQMPSNAAWHEFLRANTRNHFPLNQLHPRAGPALIWICHTSGHQQGTSKHPGPQKTLPLPSPNCSGFMLTARGAGPGCARPAGCSHSESSPAVICCCCGPAGIKHSCVRAEPAQGEPSPTPQAVCRVRTPSARGKRSVALHKPQPG